MFVSAKDCENIIGGMEFSNFSPTPMAQSLKSGGAIGKPSKRKKLRMNIFDIFKSKWSAFDMTGEDRKKLFWYLKRKTSYAAWRREAEIFDQFAGIYQQQVREEPVAPGVMETNWKLFYPDVLKAQAFYEQALERLLQGDRSIFLYNSRAGLSQATTLAGFWYTELVNHGMREDHFWIGKYEPQLTAVMRRFFDAAQQRGYLESQTEDEPAPEAWSTLWWDEFAKLPLPDTASLPEVAEPASEVLVRTGNPVPTFGIYEPQIKDGCMNYLLGGTTAPTIWESDGTYETENTLNVTWRLIWEDTRYIDGTIPAEERAYFPAASR